MEIFGFILLGLGCVIIYAYAYDKGVQAGADNMYTHLYERGVRKDDTVIVTLEYEDRSSSHEF